MRFAPSHRVAHVNSCPRSTALDSAEGPPYHLQRQQIAMLAACRETLELQIPCDQQHLNGQRGDHRVVWLAGRSACDAVGRSICSTSIWSTTLRGGSRQSIVVVDPSLSGRFLEDAQNSAPKRPRRGLPSSAPLSGPPPFFYRLLAPANRVPRRLSLSPHSMTQLRRAQNRARSPRAGHAAPGESPPQGSWMMGVVALVVVGGAEPPSQLERGLPRCEVLSCSPSAVCARHGHFCRVP